jgi:hypothetical protein
MGSYGQKILVLKMHRRKKRNCRIEFLEKKYCRTENLPKKKLSNWILVIVELKSRQKIFGKICWIPTVLTWTAQCRVMSRLWCVSSVQHSGHCFVRWTAYFHLRRIESRHLTIAQSTRCKQIFNFEKSWKFCSKINDFCIKTNRRPNTIHQAKRSQKLINNPKFSGSTLPVQSLKFLHCSLMLTSRLIIRSCSLESALIPINASR